MQKDSKPLIFALGLALGKRLMDLCCLRKYQFKVENVDTEEYFVFCPEIGSSIGESKNVKGWVRAVQYRTRSIPIQNVSFLEGTLNIFLLSKKYFRGREDGGITCQRFLGY